MVVKNMDSGVSGLDQNSALLLINEPLCLSVLNYKMRITGTG